MTEQHFLIDGLKCEGCVGTVTAALESLDPISAVAVELGEGGRASVRVTADKELSTNEIQQALSEEGNFSIVA